MKLESYILTYVKPYDGCVAVSGGSYNVINRVLKGLRKLMNYKC